MKFIKPENIIAHLGLKPGDTVADFGCGSGFYTLAVSKVVGNKGTVYAVDVQESKLTATKSASIQQGFHNVEAIKADLEKPLTEVDHGTCDVVIIASILHEVRNREAILKNAYALLKTGGHLLAVDWKAEPSPFGPSIEKRIADKNLTGLVERIGLKVVKEIPADSYHYALVFEK